MIAHPPVVIGSFFMLAGALLLAAISPAKTDFWIAEIEGPSMAPALHGERVSFSCVNCRHRVEVESQSAEQVSVIRCDFCHTNQVLPKLAPRLPSDRVIIAPPPPDGPIALGAMVAIEHPDFGLTIKRVASVTPRGYYVTGDNQAESLDSRNPRFGLIPRDQIRGIVVKILRETR